jgi:hypothetical protein
MGARPDESYNSATIARPLASIVATYVRYNGTEPLRCPSRVSTAMFAIGRVVPLVILRGVVTVPSASR